MGVFYLCGYQYLSGDEAGVAIKLVKEGGEDLFRGVIVDWEAVRGYVLQVTITDEHGLYGHLSSFFIITKDVPVYKTRRTDLLPLYGLLDGLDTVP